VQQHAFNLIGNWVFRNSYSNLGLWRNYNVYGLTMYGRTEIDFSDLRTDRAQASPLHGWFLT